MTLLMILAIFFLYSKKYSGAIFLSGCVIFLYQLLVLPAKLPEPLDNKKAVILGKVTSRIISKIHFKTFTVNSIEVNNKAHSNLTIRINDYSKIDNLEQGDVIKAIIKLKKFRNYQTPSSPKYTEIQIAKGYSAYGYVVKWLLLNKGKQAISERARNYVSKLIDKLYANKEVQGLMKSVLIGQREALTKEDWTRFQKTGTSHLIAISGLHIGLITGLSYFLFCGLWSRFAYLCRHIPAYQAAAVLAMVIGFSYATIAGFAIPTQRAVIMSSTFLLANAFNKKSYIWHSYVLSMFLVLTFNPYSIYFIGFYLSFGVVFILIWFYQKSPWFFLSIQIKIWLLLLPTSLFVFHFYSVISIVANLVAIPLFSFFILPLGFLSIAVENLSFPLAKLTALMVSYISNFLYICLDYLKLFDELSIRYVISNYWQVGFITILIFIALHKKRLATSLLVVALIFLALLPNPILLKPRQAKLFVLDVGQGLAVVVQTKSHLLLYDAGNQFTSGFDLGKMVVIPFLKTLGTSKIDTVVISHEDQDHRGGFHSVNQLMQVNNTFRNHNCYKANAWQWDGVKFYFLKNNHKTKLSENNRSCVLVIENNYQRILLPGDIEQKMEHYYANKYAKNLKSTVLISPHHGSKTSSSRAFLAKVLPKYVFISSGKYNRYGMPHKSVIKQYKTNNIQIYNTADCGMISWLMQNNASIAKVNCYTPGYVRNPKYDLSLNK